MATLAQQGNAGVAVALNQRETGDTRRRDLWAAALVAVALVAVLLGVARPFDAHAVGDQPIPSILAD